MNMYKYIISSSLLLLAAFTLTARPVKADSLSKTAGREEKVRFVYDVNFEMDFDNREFSKSSFSKSMTIFGARLTPSVGLAVSQPEVKMNHRLMLGIDIMKDFGATPLQASISDAPADETSSKLSNWNLFRDITFYYNLEKRFQQTKLELYAGIFPRSRMSDAYSEVFFSDSLKFYDPNLEGAHLKISHPRVNWEVCCDWVGQKAYARKEKFMIFSALESNITSYFKLGYAAYMLHFAGSGKARGVVDNILLNPYARFDFGQMMSLQEFSVRIGYLQAMQHDRVFVGHYVFPRGGELDLTIRKWNVGISNKLFYGTSMMPYYNSTDAGGDKYGSRLYLGDPFYRIHETYSSKPGLYDRLEVFYEPHIGRYLAIRIGARFHFHGSRYTGCQQTLSLLFNLNSLLNK